eukprot:Hpha_TRINITY_DN16060_c0_g2::TRINITY_DN16060_c0_g2_i1::g.119416::m.119416
MRIVRCDHAGCGKLIEGINALKEHIAKVHAPSPTPPAPSEGPRGGKRATAGGQRRPPGPVQQSRGSAALTQSRASLESAGAPVRSTNGGGAAAAEADKKADNKIDNKADKKADKKVNKIDNKIDKKADKKVDKTIDNKADEKVDNKIDNKADNKAGVSNEAPPDASNANDKVQAKAAAGLLNAADITITRPDMIKLLAAHGVTRTISWIKTLEEQAERRLSFGELVDLHATTPCRPRIPRSRMVELLAERGVVRTHSWIYLQEKRAGRELSVEELVKQIKKARRPLSDADDSHTPSHTPEGTMDAREASPRRKRSCTPPQQPPEKRGRRSGPQPASPPSSTAVGPNGTAATPGLQQGSLEAVTRDSDSCPPAQHGEAVAERSPPADGTIGTPQGVGRGRARGRGSGPSPTAAVGAPAQEQLKKVGERPQTAAKKSAGEVARNATPKITPNTTVRKGSAEPPLTQAAGVGRPGEWAEPPSGGDAGAAGSTTAQGSGSSGSGFAGPSNGFQPQREVGLATGQLPHKRRREAESGEGRQRKARRRTSTNEEPAAVLPPLSVPWAGDPAPPPPAVSKSRMGHLLAGVRTKYDGAARRLSPEELLELEAQEAEWAMGGRKAVPPSFLLFVAAWSPDRLSSVRQLWSRLPPKERQRWKQQPAEARADYDKAAALHTRGAHPQQ